MAVAFARWCERRHAMLTLLILLVLLALLFGGWGASRGYGYMGWSPFGLLLLILVILALTGNLSF